MKILFLLLGHFFRMDTVITPRNSPRLYLGDAREHYKTQQKLEMDEWKE